MLSVGSAADSLLGTSSNHWSLKIPTVPKDNIKKRIIYVHSSFTQEDGPATHNALCSHDFTEQSSCHEFEDK